MTYAKQVNTSISVCLRIQNPAFRLETTCMFHDETVFYFNAFQCIDMFFYVAYNKHQNKRRIKWKKYHNHTGEEL